MGKKSRTFTHVWTDDNEHEWLVSYHLDGRYYPATQTEPAEYPELVIESVVSNETQREWLDVPEDIMDKIIDSVNDNHHNNEAEDYECYHGEN